jgi:Kef-type K+ transport system membrane component KefB
LTRLLGYLAAVSWLLLAVVTAYGITRGGQNSVTINMIVAAIFAGIAVLLYLRHRAVEDVRSGNPDRVEIRRLLLIEGIFAALGLVSGCLLLTAAAFRVWREGMPVFG